MEESDIYYIISGVSFAIAIICGLFYLCYYRKTMKQRRAQQPQTWVVMTHQPAVYQPGAATLSPSHVVPGTVIAAAPAPVPVGPGHGEFSTVSAGPGPYPQQPPPYFVPAGAGAGGVPPNYFGATSVVTSQTLDPSIRHTGTDMRMTSSNF